MAGSDFNKRLCKICGVGRSEMERFVIKDKVKRLRMQSGAADKAGGWGAVKCIAQSRVP
jgi:hypothetical protein